MNICMICEAQFELVRQDQFAPYHNQSGEARTVPTIRPSATSATLPPNRMPAPRTMSARWPRWRSAESPSPKAFPRSLGRLP